MCACRGWKTTLGSCLHHRKDKQNFSFWDQVFLWTQTTLFQLDRLTKEPRLLGAFCHPRFYVSAGETNSGSHAGIAGTFPTVVFEWETSPIGLHTKHLVAVVELFGEAAEPLAGRASLGGSMSLEVCSKNLQPHSICGLLFLLYVSRWGWDFPASCSSHGLSCIPGHYGLPLWNYKPKQTFSSISWFWLMVFYCSNRTNVSTEPLPQAHAC